MKYIKIIAIIFCIIMCLGGAVNVGPTKFFMAIPFFIILLIVGFRVYSRKFFKHTIIFVVFCILFSLTATKNPLVFPVLLGEQKVIVTKDMLYRLGMDKSGAFIPEDSDYFKRVSITDRGMFELKKGQEFKIESVYNFGGIDSKNKNYLVTDFANFTQEDVDNKYIDIGRKNIQSKWSEVLGKLMYWPWVPFLVVQFFQIDRSM